MNAPLYTTEILRLAASLPEPQQLDRVDAAAAQRSPTCGSTVATEVQIKGGRIEAISQAVSACAFGQASATLVARQAPGRDRAEPEAARHSSTTFAGFGRVGRAALRSPSADRAAALY